jgi:urease accessory protein
MIPANLVSPSLALTAALPIDAPSTVLQRARGTAEIGFAVRDRATRAHRVYQEGQAKLRLPRVYGADATTAVVINTAGGLTGGDVFRLGAAWDADSRATLTTQAAERIYRAGVHDGAAEVLTSLTVGDGATAEWLPQETILFDRARLIRRLEVDLAATADLLITDSLVFGRTAMGESISDCRLADHWRIRRAGKLVHAESLALDGDATAILAGPATGGGAVALATVIHLAPHVERRIDEARALIESAATEAAVSAWDGKLVARFLHWDARLLRADLVRFLEAWRGRSLPRPWSC